MLFRFGMDERSTKPEYGHFDAILPAQATDEQVFRMPKHAPMAPSTEAWQFLQELYHPVPTKREVKREPAGPCKRERMLPAGGGVVAILDSEEEKDVSAPVVKRPKAEIQSRAGAGSMSWGGFGCAVGRRCRAKHRCKRESSAIASCNGRVAEQAQGPRAKGARPLAGSSSVWC